MVEFLLDKGADINRKTKFPYTGPTPLTWAIENEQEGGVQALLTHGAIIRNGFLGTAIALCNRKMTEPLLTKLEHGQCKPNSLVCAVWAGDMDIFKLLLNKALNEEEAWWKQ